MRIANLICRRGYNIESLSVGRTDVPGLSRFTVIIEGEEGAYEQIRKQLMKLIEVVEVRNLTKEGPFVERWLSLVKVLAPVDRRPHILQTAEACLEALKPYGILETAGSGQVALSRTGFAN